MATSTRPQPPDAASLDVLPHLGSQQPRGTPRPSKRGRWRAGVLIGIHVAIALHVAHWLTSGATLTPLEPSEAGQTLTLGLVNAGFILFVLLILSTLVLGRFFCGWGCHVVALQDLCAWLLGRIGIRPRPIRSRLLMLVPTYAALRMFVFPSLPLLAGWLGLGPEIAAPTPELDLVTEDFWARFPGWGIGLLTFGVSGFVIVYFFGSKGFCTYGCPYGAVFGAADRFAPGRIRVTDACEGCGHCTATCTSNIDVRSEVARFGQVVDAGCMKCMDCVSVCPKDALYFGFGASRRSAVASKKPSRTFDFTWPEEIAMALTFAAGVYAFGNLYSLLPFLLTLGLAVLASLALVTLARLARQGSLTLQHTPLKVGGKLRPAGWAAALGAALYLALVGHSAWIQYHVKAGERLFFAAGKLEPASSARASTLTAAIGHLDSADRYALVDEARIHNLLGQLHLARGGPASRSVGALELERSLALEPTLAAPRLQLADLAMRAGDPAGALDQLRGILEHYPAHPEVAARLQKLVLANPENADAVLLMVSIHVANGDPERARDGLDYVLQRWPERADARALLESLE